MELKWLKDFVSLAQYSSFSRAAQERNITQSALSRRIRQLENWVGMPLIDRSSNPIKLTAAGASFLPSAHDAIDLLYNSRKWLYEQYNPVWEVLSFATLNSLSLSFFPLWMADMEAVGDEFRVRFTDPHASFLGNMSTLVHGQCDFFLTYALDDVKQMEDLKKFPFLSVGMERVIAVSAPNRDGSPMHSLTKSYLPTHFLSYRSNAFFSLALQHLIEKRQYNLHSVYENGMSSALKAMAISGHGVTWVPQSLVNDELSRGLLVRAGTTEDDLLVEIRIYRTHNFRNQQAEKFWRRASYLTTLKAEKALPAG
ncbi:LysR family transcriptional regulator [Paenochrobactrum glaciei]|uniref:LysR substrate-binding domain-containing protein n=1 Tax=Paenochrobactrum glaciei TaxID=486407 RepID=A0ABN1G7Q2_9HYPH